MSTLLQTFLLVLSITSMIAEAAVYDYCSLSHSAFVMERIDQEVLPAYAKFNVQLKKSCPFHENPMNTLRDQITAYQQKKITQGRHECSKCKKGFKNADYLEFHMKMNHYSYSPAYSQISEFPQNNVEYGICLSDYCDIFECRENSEKTLRHQIFINRESNYEGKAEKKVQAEPYRYNLIKQLSPEIRDRFESQCVNLFLSCIDLDLTVNEDAIEAFDILYNIFCRKFKEISLEEEIQNEVESKGINALIAEVEGWGLSQQGTYKNQKKNKNQEIWNVLKIIMGIFAVILVVLYYTGIYFTLFDEDTGLESKKKSKQAEFIKDYK